MSSVFILNCLLLKIATKSFYFFLGQTKLVEHTEATQLEELDFSCTIKTSKKDQKGQKILSWQFLKKFQNKKKSSQWANLQIESILGIRMQ